jgi:VIT1/CCC1 family predicted Fe2+/Mn2+ transporter
MLSIVVSIIAFFVTTYYFKRYLEELDIPKGMTRGALIFTAALLVSYLVAVLVDYLSP